MEVTRKRPGSPGLDLPVKTAITGLDRILTVIGEVEDLGVYKCACEAWALIVGIESGIKQCAVGLVESLKGHGIQLHETAVATKRKDKAAAGGCSLFFTFEFRGKAGDAHGEAEFVVVHIQSPEAVRR